jgi:hypothetical protein
MGADHVVDHRKPLDEEMKARGLSPRYVASLTHTDRHFAAIRRAALAEEFAAASGQYFDNDSGQFASPHPDALDPRKSQEIVRVIETLLTKL